jgi:DNA polymerase I-like protein with 3'-5' exonuclease and polymerase domains
MAAIIKTDRLDEYSLNREERDWVYCGLDSLIMFELREKISPMLNDNHRTAYRYLQGIAQPALAMMLRGLPVDMAARNAAIDELVPRIRNLSGYERLTQKNGKTKWALVDDSAVLQRLARAIWGKPLNPNSSKQIAELLYGTLRLPEQYARSKGGASVTVGFDALVKLRKEYPRAFFITTLLIRFSELVYQLDIIRKPIDEDNHIRCSYNITGTETFRWSSSTSVFHTGTNLQNISKPLRNLFVPESEEFCIFDTDLEQAESRTVAYLSGDDNYIEACESGDLHTKVAAMIFGIPEVKDKAEEKYYKNMSFRDMSKRGGHGLNYGLTALSLARNMGIETAEAYRVYLGYLGGSLDKKSVERMKLLEAGLEANVLGDLVEFEGAFPGIRKWHEWIEEQLATVSKLVTPFRFERTFWSRPEDSSTLREAIAHVPQSTIGTLLNIGLWRIYNELDGPDLRIRAQVHDSIVGEIRKSKLDELVPRVIDCMENPVPINGRIMVIPSKVELGDNWRDLESVDEYKQRLSA